MWEHYPGEDFTENVEEHENSEDRIIQQFISFVYCKDVEEHIRCPKYTEIKTFKQTKIHTWPKEEAPWIRVHMDHKHIRDLDLFLILVDSF